MNAKKAKKLRKEIGVKGNNRTYVELKNSGRAYCKLGTIINSPNSARATYQKIKRSA